MHIHTYIGAVCIDDRPTMQQLSKVLRMEHIEITIHWYHLGLDLGISNKTLREIEIDHPNDVKTCCHLMFEQWLEKTPHASWKQIIAALDKIGLKATVDAVTKVLKTGQSLN